MSELRTGNLLIRTKENSIQFQIVGAKAAYADIASSDLPELLGFFKSYLHTQSNRRIGFRIDLTQIRTTLSDRLFITVATSQGQFAATPIDLSLTGICVASNHHLGRKGAKVEVIISYEQLYAVLPAVVVRHDGAAAHTAFHFVDSVNEGEPDPAPELEIIFRKLEALWLDHCLQLEWASEAVV